MDLVAKLPPTVIVDWQQRGYFGFCLHPPETEGRILIYGVASNSPAKKAKLRVGDIFLKMDGKKFDNREDMFVYKRGIASGDIVTIEVERNGKVMQFELKAEEWPEGLR